MYPVNGTGNYPLVAFLHGCCKDSVEQSHTDYTALHESLASNGMVVAAVNTGLGKPDLVRYSHDQLHMISALAQRTEMHEVLGKVDFSNVVLMGHSSGGGGTLGSATTTTNPLPNTTIRAAVAIDPAPPPLTNSSVLVPTFFMVGQNDTIVPPVSVLAWYALANKQYGNHVFAELENAGHCDIQKPAYDPSVWNVYIVAFTRCALQASRGNTSSAECDMIYGNTTSTALCSAGYMVSCLEKD